MNVFKLVVKERGSVDVNRSKVAKEVMKGSAISRSSNALHTAKSKSMEEKSSYLHFDPIQSLCIMKHTMHLNAIHDIGLSPFSIDYWTNDQIHAYKRVCQIHGASICINFTSLKVLPIEKPYDNETHKIFLYLLW